MTKFPIDRIRNFSIIAHVDHGKSTLADRLLEMTGTINTDDTNKQVLDKLKVERERGITVKAQTCTMIMRYKGEEYLLNLIDTPGHVDFSYEVSRSLAACQGTLLLVDACQGIQAQTVANFYLAFSQGLIVLPVINKTDLPSADVERVVAQIRTTFDIATESDVLAISAKTGINVEKVLPLVIDNISPPTGKLNAPLKALLFDSWYDQYLGVVALFAIIDGKVSKGDKLLSSYSGRRYDVSEVGLMHPERVPTSLLQSGQVGYIICNMKEPSEAHIGDTFSLVSSPVEALPGFAPAKSMVFAGIYPIDASDFSKLDDSINRLTLNDNSVSVQKDSSTALGQGWRLGFLGTLHMDVFRQRLEDEHGASLIVTQPTVPYRVVYRNGDIKDITNPADFPEQNSLMTVEEIQEPLVLATIIFPEEHLGEMMELCASYRGEQIEYRYLDELRVLVKYSLPLSEVVMDFYSELKSKSSGYATFDYEDGRYAASNVVKLSVLVNGKPIDALASIMHQSRVERVGRSWAQRLKEVIPRQQFEVIIQTAVGGKIVARETIKPYRKDVGMKGSKVVDQYRKKKLLDAQREGKKRMKSVGDIQLPQQVFYNFLGERRS